MSASANIAFANHIYDLFNRGDLDPIWGHASHDCALVFVPFGMTQTGPSGFKEFAGGLKSAFPDLTLTITNQVADDTHVVSEFTAIGTHRGPLMTPSGPLPPTGRVVHFTVCEVWTVEGGKLTRLVNYQDAASLMRQLGA